MGTMLMSASLALLVAVCLWQLATSASGKTGTSRQKQGKARAAPAPQPTQYEIAMLETLKGIREGRFPDPAMRKADGTPGDLLDALLPPEEPSDEERHIARRQLAAGWRLYGANLPFANGATLSAFNQSYYRWASVNSATAVDWRLTAQMTPIQVQFNCASCWLMASADVAAIAWAIATNQSAIPAGVQQYCDCSGNACCQGGWPEDFFSWLVAQGNITTKSYYPYWALDGRTCRVGSDYPVAAEITGVERVPIYSQSALMKAVNMQPVMVYISASSPDFLAYNSTGPGTPGFNVYDGNCSTEVNHAVVVVGYNTSASTPYWIIKNTWPAYGWGHNGYMYLAMEDGPGKCGMLTVNPVYPVFYPNAPTQITTQMPDLSPVLVNGQPWWQWYEANQDADPCAGVINPCGSGTCWNDQGIARCDCVAPYVESIGAPTSKCVDPSPCTSSQFNPCGAGWCLDVGDGGYICGCPNGYTIGVQVNGAPTCVPVLVTTLKGKNVTYLAQNGDSCQSVSKAFGLKKDDVQKQNTFLNCDTSMLIPGQSLMLLTNAIVCSQAYAMQPTDTCPIVAYNILYNSNFLLWLRPSYWGFNSSAPVSDTNVPPSLLGDVPTLSGYWRTSTSVLTQMNPSLDCSNLYMSELVCVNSPALLSTAKFICGASYMTAQGDTCANVAAAFNMTTANLKSLNPGLSCTAKKGFLTVGIQLCVGAVTPPTSGPLIANCTQYYTVQQGDSCAQIWNAANLSQFQFMYINPGLQCQAPFLYVGQRVCINSLLLNNIPDPNYLIYTVQPGDDLPTVQSKFVPKCQGFSISFQRIASQNNISDYTTWTLPSNATIVIPCVPKIGASCGCTPSLIVCGVDGINYPSYCDAMCNFASQTGTPVWVVTASPRRLRQAAPPTTSAPIRSGPHTTQMPS